MDYLYTNWTLGLRDGLISEGGEVGGGPCVLEVESAGDTVDVEEFSDNVEVWAVFTLHGFEVYFFEVYSATGDEFLFEGAFLDDV